MKVRRKPAEFTRVERERWGRIFKEVGIEPQQQQHPRGGTCPFG